MTAVNTDCIAQHRSLRCPNAGVGGKFPARDK